MTGSEIAMINAYLGSDMPVSARWWRDDVLRSRPSFMVMYTFGQIASGVGVSMTIDQLRAVVAEGQRVLDEIEAAAVARDSDEREAANA